ncbi:MAG: DUF4070 domain-containing protein [Candidatus Aureabacteria bacterium]|nr:DUF4070 domain-containing protein [Candidatus Auribacterota bacterium]
MKIKLIFPGRELLDTEMVMKNHLVPSETLTAIAAATPPQHEVVVVDENVQRLDLDDTPDLVGITVYTFLAPRAYKIADSYRSRGIHVVLGGLHVTGVPGDALNHADTIFIGEAEVLWARFLSDLERGNAQRIYGPTFPSDLDALPFPRKDLLKRQRSIASLVRQIRDQGDSYYIFFDDNLTVDRSFARALCHALKPLGIRWRCAASIDLGYDEELVRAMAESGCESIFIGFESINAGSLDESSKHHNRRLDYERLIGILQRNKILINAAFVFGFDHDTPSVFRETVQFAIQNRLTSVNFHILTPFPGTCLYNRLMGEGRILTRDWSLYDTGHVVFRPKHLTPEELTLGYRRVYREFYSWRNILRRLPGHGLRYALRTLTFNIALKKMDWIWHTLQKWNLLYTTFHLYFRKSGAENPRIAFDSPGRAFVEPSQGDLPPERCETANPLQKGTERWT